MRVAPPLSNPSTTAPVDNRSSLRSRIRAQRRALSTAVRNAAARHLVRIAMRAFLLRPGRRIGLYFAHGHEIDTAPLIERALRCGCRVYLPVITDYREMRMQFIEYRPGTALRRNRYGILEPDPAGERIAVRRLDVIFVPLVAVDRRGWRLGSGAGFYDRCLHHLRPGRIWRRPHLFGLAYELQRVDELVSQPWDVPLDGLITEKRCYRWPEAAASELRPRPAAI